jgi:hypothetical protein
VPPPAPRTIPTGSRSVLDDLIGPLAKRRPCSFVAFDPSRPMSRRQRLFGFGARCYGSPMHPRPLRLSADLNACVNDARGEWCWSLRYDGQPLNDVAETLGVFEGMTVTLFHEDEHEGFEVDAVLGRVGDWPRWMALPNWDTFRQIHD